MSDWISIKDKLPASSEQVICHDGDYAAEMFYDMGEFKFSHSAIDDNPDDYDIKFKNSITHWMPMPVI